MILAMYGNSIDKQNDAQISIGRKVLIPRTTAVQGNRWCLLTSRVLGSVLWGSRLFYLLNKQEIDIIADKPCTICPVPCKFRCHANLNNN